jgi:hypothetical protein
MTRKGPVDLSGMDRRFFEGLSPEARVELLCRLHALAIEQAEKLARDSTNSSRPPSSDGPFGPASGTSPGTMPPPTTPLAVDRRPSLGHDRTMSNALIDLANSLHEVAFYRRRWRAILKSLFSKKINSLSRSSSWPKLGRRSTPS